MTQIRLKRVYEDMEAGDGFRVLVDRLWPRGMKKESLHYDLWDKNITPSNELRKWVHADMDGRWDDFSVMYQKELDLSPSTKEFIEKIKKNDVVTLLYASKEPLRNHAIVLKSYLDKILNK